LLGFPWIKGAENVGDVEGHWLKRKVVIVVVEWVKKCATVNAGERHADGKERGGGIIKETE
jgi:hypothetical protein